MRELEARVFPAGIWVVDCAGECRYASARWTAISGLSLEQTLGRGWARAIHPADVAMVLQGWLAFKRGPISLEFRIRRPDASIRWVSLRSAETSIESDGLESRVATVEDISAQKRSAPASASNLGGER